MRGLTCHCAALAVFAVFATSAATSADDVIWSQVGSPVAPAQPSSDFVASWEHWDIEVADDFDLVGLITRVRAIGQTGPFLSPGAWIRFYQVHPDGGPGELLVEHFFDDSDPLLLANDWIIEAVLPEPLEVDGRLFVSVQQKLNSGSSDPTVAAFWRWNGTLNGFPIGDPSYIRNPGGGWDDVCASWCQTGADRIFLLFGELYEPPPPPPAPTITAAAPDFVPRSGRFIISGSNFTADQDEHELLLNGIPGPHAAWTNDEIHAYVPGDAPLGAATVQVITAGGASNVIEVNVQPSPPPDGRVKWRFLADHINLGHRAGIGSDGTVYFTDSGGDVYAVGADGGLKWIFNMVGGGNEGPVVVGADDTIYVAGNPLGPDVNLHALNPDGTLRWLFTDSGTQGIIAGPAVGPDGHIYAVTDQGGLGAFALSSKGDLLWNNPGSPVMAEHAQIGAEIVFGPAQDSAADRFYVAFDQDILHDRLYGFTLDGAQLFSVITGGIDDPFYPQTQAAVGPDGSIYVTDFGPEGGVGWRLKSFNPGGGLNWVHFDIGTNALTNPEAGPDGTVYIGRNFRELHAIHPDGTLRWMRVDANIYQTPVVRADNAMILIGGVPDFGMPGFMQAASTEDGALLWQVDLPTELGGNIVPASRALFSPDGSTAYFGTAYLSPEPQDQFSYLYAIDTTVDVPGPGDIDGDGAVGFSDLLILLANWGDCPAPPADCPADLDADSTVGFRDLLILLAHWTG